MKRPGRRIQLPPGFCVEPRKRNLPEGSRRILEPLGTCNGRGWGPRYRAVKGACPSPPKRETLEERLIL